MCLFLNISFAVEIFHNCTLNFHIFFIFLRRYFIVGKYRIGIPTILVVALSEIFYTLSKT